MINKRILHLTDGRQRHHLLHRAHIRLVQIDDLLLVGVCFFLFLYPLFLNPTLINDWTAWLWWVKGHAWMGLLAWGAGRFLIGLWLTPSQLTGASVEAMEQAAPLSEPLPFQATPTPVASPLPANPTIPTQQEQETYTQLQNVWQCLRRRPHHRLSGHAPLQPFIPPPSRFRDSSL